MRCKSETNLRALDYRGMPACAFVCTLFLAASAFASVGKANEAPNESQIVLAVREQHARQTRASIQDILWSSESKLSSLSPKMLDQLLTFYTSRNFEPAWTGTVEATRNAAEVRAVLVRADQEGLNSADYRRTASKWSKPAVSGPDAGEYDLSFTEELLRYSADVRLGRFRPNDIDKDTALPSSDFDPVARLIGALQGHSLAGYLNDLPPSRREYRNLIEGLARYRKIDQLGGWPSLPGSDEIRLDGDDSRVGALIARLVAEDPALTSVSNPTGAELKQAVKRFQERNGLEADGRAGRGTIAALKIPASSRIEQIIANLERWRWLPSEFEPRYIAVNVPDQTLVFVRDGDVVLTSRVIIGHDDSRTPILRTEVIGAVANPPWNVPGDIAATQLLPKLRKNHDYLAARNMVLVNGPKDDPHGLKIDWNRVSINTFPYQVRQLARPNSALGVLMLDSPNDFDVYLHDTPGKSFFDIQSRSISNGCVRVQDILALTSLALSNDIEAGSYRIREAIGSGKTQYLEMSEPLPLYMVYWTAIADDDGSVGFRPDRYGRDKRLISALRKADEMPNLASTVHADLSRDSVPSRALVDASFRSLSKK